MCEMSEILSAAHCASESWLIRWLPMDAVAGMHNVNVFKSPVQVNQIKERIRHPLYNGGIGPHDIALFKTMLPFRFTKAVKPIKLPTNFNNEPSASALKVIGWGALSTTFFFPDLPDNLQEVKVKAIPFRDCYNLIEALKEIYESNPLDKQSNLCTGPTSGGIAACAGDSGGPLVQIRNIDPPTTNPVEENVEIHNASLYKKEQGRLEEGKPQADNVESVLLGVVSWGVSPCGEVGAPTVYTNVSNYIDFINYAIKT
ncbi:unnamed protein product [Arctia plantaginis]|uniref:Peptidase S1 domain-containing protein n=1 Tax=Arctia plantaginis TaxID=874455 RepID=A0A8S1A5Y8_ARCPL|nr:unnamed protein product [Arctia plantaginis]